LSERSGGNTVELYVDAESAVWREDLATVATVKPLALG
jgi:hypothetical protein